VLPRRLKIRHRFLAACFVKLAGAATLSLRSLNPVVADLERAIQPRCGSSGTKLIAKCPRLLLVMPVQAADLLLDILFDFSSRLRRYVRR
jgi:hypothetical protein